MTRKTRSRNKPQTTRFHNTGGSGPAFPLDKEKRKANMATRKGRKPNRKSKRAGRRRRKNTGTTARVSAPRSTARFTNRKKRTHRRRRNTGSSFSSRMRNVGASSTTGLIIAGAGIIAFDMATAKFLGAQSAPIGAATKIGGGYLLANNGKKLPVIGQHAELIGAVLIVNGVVDLLRIYVLPRVTPYLPAALLPAPPAAAIGNGAGVAGLANWRGMGGLTNIPPGSALNYGGGNGDYFGA